ncbi:DNA polymerase I [Sabulicella glaciei]|uniref:DNA polymerase I n=1 Tax=Sabulicella glaciei TaxID=2984948 RepID=A0ABT3NXD8_9PROT|nr:DNA polymerase I [Roseococcus sp. MDT2-1-1]MCW8086838.1 DNA polymerase I [Roseococcus sp. MDT2-1-1]
MTTTTEAAAAPEAEASQPHLVLVDGSGYIFRAYHALPPVTRPDGTQVNAVFGFSQMLERFLREHTATHLAVVFDHARKTFRSEIFPEYKAHRPPPDPELVPQFALIREATAAFGVSCVEQPGFEADDLIAAYAREFTEKTGGRVTIVSSDKDLMQLIRPGVVMLEPIKRTEIGEAQVLEKFGVPPTKVVEVQALAGDSTDNVPGVPGIGVKTAAQLITEYGDLETLLERAGEIKQPKRREALLENAEKARISRRLVLLDENTPLPEPVEALKAKPPEPARLRAFLEENNFRSILARTGLGNAAEGKQDFRIVAPARPAVVDPAAAPFGPYATIQDLDALNAVIREARETGILAVDTETDSLDALNANLVGICLATAPGRACYVPLRHRGRDMLEPVPPQIPLEDAVAALRPVMEDPAVLKLLLNAKYDLEVLARPENGALAVTPFDDVMLISYAMDAGRHGHGMDELALEHLGHTCTTYNEVTGTGRARIPFAEVPLDRATHYGAEDADVTLRLWRLLKPRLLPEKSLALYEKVERRMVPVLMAMEQEGIRVDREELERIGQDFTERLVVIEARIHELAGRPFSVGSPKQLGEILFDEMGLKGGRKGKTGAYSTDAQVLEDLAAQGHALPRAVLEWRQIAKLKTTYVDGLIAQIATDGRVHTDFSMAITSTGRLSSTEPNLQNIPIRTEEGARLRRAFVAEPGHLLLAADYSQIELRLLAHLAEVPSLMEAFGRGEDIHARTAADIFGLPLEAVDREARRRAKTLNFGIIYGMSAFGLAARLGIPTGEAKGVIDAYFARYPGILAAMERIKDEARTNKFVCSPFGRRLWIRNIDDRNPAFRAGAERQAINAPFQGGAAEVIKRAMVRVPRALADAGLRGRMLLQVHDELVLEVPEEEAEATGTLLRGVMEGVATLRVPLLVEIGTGRNWAEAH